MTRPAAANVLAERESATSRIVIAAIALVIAGGLAAIDSTWGPDRVVIGTVVLAPFVVSLFAGPRDTAFVGAFAVLLAALSGIWNDNASDGAYLLRLVLVVAGSCVAVVAARSRVRTIIANERFGLLSALAAVGDERISLEETAARLCELIVPRFADVCMIDAVHGDGLRRLSVRVSLGADDAVDEARLRALPPNAPPPRALIADPGQGTAAAPAGAVTGTTALDETEMETFRALGASGLMVVPLKARGRSLGTLTLLICRGAADSYTREDLEFAEVLAGRAALALDSAGLSSDLRASQEQLTTALGSLAEAVTVQGPQGGLVYANQAAADLLGFGSPEELLATPLTAIVDRFDSYMADGSPLDLNDIPGRQVLAGLEPEPLEVRAIDKQTGEETWRLTKASGVRDEDGQLQLVVNVIADITAVKRAETTQRLLARVGEVLASSLDYEHTLQQVADLAVPRLADWCAVSLPDGRGFIPSVAVAHVDPDKVSLARDLGARYPVSVNDPEGVGQVFRDGVPQCANDITDEMLVLAAKDSEHLEQLRSIGMRAALVLPMTSGGGNVGVLTLVSAESGRSFSQEDIDLAAELARRAGAAVANARLYTERTEIARTLQTSLLPEDLPELTGWRTEALYRPAGDENLVGGDFYDAFRISDGEMFIVGDVTGRGAQAAALTGLMRHTLRTAAMLTDSPRRALSQLNRELLARPAVSLCTAVCAVLRETADGAEAEIFCAGHPLPLRVRGGMGEYVGRFGVVLGAYADENWEPVRVQLQPGDVLVLYSDGALDTVGEDQRFGPDRLLDAVTGASGAQDVVRRIDAALIEFQVGEQADDTAVLAIERTGEQGA